MSARFLLRSDAAASSLLASNSATFIALIFQTSENPRAPPQPKREAGASTNCSFRKCYYGVLACGRDLAPGSRAFPGWTVAVTVAAIGGREEGDVELVSKMTGAGGHLSR